MIVRTPYSWLKDFAAFELTTNELVDACNSLGMVVEAVHEIGNGLEGVVVAKVLDVRTHPNADHVRLADVDLGDGEPLQIACGAPNLAVGQTVAVATVGSVLPGNFEIARRKLRGTWSNGMICSSDELGLSDTRASGIMVLPDNLSAGAAFADAMHIERDVVVELAIETNRPDAMCIAGVARDLAAKCGLTFSLPNPSVKESGPRTREVATVTVTATDLCDRFVARVLQNVTIGPSPDWIIRRLALAGMRSINNVVDASNYVMLELGQPTHPYDLDQLSGQTVGVRIARSGETLVTLDGTLRSLGIDSPDIVICDGEDRVVGIAGIMGGTSSEISDKTTRVLLEAAHFDAMTIARSVRRLKLRSEASGRFERGVDPLGIDLAVARFCELLDAEVAPEAIDISNLCAVAKTVLVRTARVNAVLGTELTTADVANYIGPLGFVTAPGDDGLAVTIPSYRGDATREIDVIEEVARHHGYEAIAKTQRRSPHVGGLSSRQRTRRALRALFSGVGCDEAWTTTLLGPTDFDRCGLPMEPALRLVNPVNEDESLLRTSLLPGLLRAIALNANRRNPDVRLAEFGHCFRVGAPGADLPDEAEHAAAVFAVEGDDAGVAVRTWMAVESILEASDVMIENAQVSALHPTRSAELRRGETVVGVVGEVDPAVLARYEIDRRVGYLSVDLDILMTNDIHHVQSKPLSRYPSSDVDLAFALTNDVSGAAVAATLRAAGGDLLESVTLFDTYRAEGLRSLAYRLRFIAPDRTLSDEELSSLRLIAIDAVVATHGATLRGVQS